MVPRAAVAGLVSPAIGADSDLRHLYREVDGETASYWRVIEPDRFESY
jgi:hypothetical protein